MNFVWLPYFLSSGHAFGQSCRVLPLPFALAGKAKGTVTWW